MAPDLAQDESRWTGGDGGAPPARPPAPLPNQPRISYMTATVS